MNTFKATDVFSGTVNDLRVNKSSLVWFARTLNDFNKRIYQLVTNIKSLVIDKQLELLQTFREEGAEVLRVTLYSTFFGQLFTQNVLQTRIMVFT